MRRGWLPMTLGTLGYFVIYFVLFWLCLHICGLVIGVGTMLAAFALGRLLTSVAVTPGGLGLVEAGSVALLVAMGADPAQAAAGTLLFTIFTHVLEIPFGIVAWLVWLWGRKQEVHQRGRRGEHVVGSAGTARATVTPGCRYHSRPNTQPNSGGGTRVNTPSVRAPESAVACVACARIDARRARACRRTSMQWVTSGGRGVGVRPRRQVDPAGRAAAAGSPGAARRSSRSRGTVASSSTGVPASSRGRGGDPVHRDVVRVTVAAVGVVPGHHVRALLAPASRPAGPPPRRDVGVGQPGRPAGRRRRSRIVGQPGIGVAEHLDPAHPERVRRGVQLGQPPRTQPAVGPQLVGGQTRLAGGGHHQHHPMALRGQRRPWCPR